MKAKNLRIGNIVDTINRSGEIHFPNEIPMKIFEINPFEVIIYNPKKHPSELKTITVIGMEDVCGIRLTEKWLLNLGFKKDEVSYFDKFNHNGNVSYNIRKGSFSVNNFFEINNIEYVHELQNLFFAITGRELELRQDVSA